MKYFSGTALPRILKFGINVGYDLFYCVNQPPAYFFYLCIFLSLQSNLLILDYLADYLAPLRARVFKFCIHIESGQIYCGKENKDTEIHFCLLFPFFLFSISHSNVIHRKICVQDFSGTALPRILKLV